MTQELKLGFQDDESLQDIMRALQECQRQDHSNGGSGVTSIVVGHTQYYALEVKPKLNNRPEFWRFLIHEWRMPPTLQKIEFQFAFHNIVTDKDERHYQTHRQRLLQYTTELARTWLNRYSEEYELEQDGYAHRTEEPTKHFIKGAAIILIRKKEKET